ITAHQPSTCDSTKGCRAHGWSYPASYRISLTWQKPAIFVSLHFGKAKDVIAVFGGIQHERVIERARQQFSLEPERARGGRWREIAQQLAVERRVEWKAPLDLPPHAEARLLDLCAQFAPAVIAHMAHVQFVVAHAPLYCRNEAPSSTHLSHVPQGRHIVRD